MSTKSIKAKARKQGMALRFDRKLRAWCLIDIHHNALIAQFSSPEEASAWMDD